MFWEQSSNKALDEQNIGFPMSVTSPIVKNVLNKACNSQSDLEWFPFTPQSK